MQTQYRVLGYRIDLYFHKHKLAIKVDELGHADSVNIFKEINKIHRHIKKSTKKSLIDDLSKRLFKCLVWIVKKVLPTI